MEQDHKISLFTAILIGINIMVGVGIFRFPSLMAARAGNASFLAWPIIALIFLPIVLSIAAIARVFPGAGSFYGYSKETINQTAGFISGWAFYLGYTGVAALMITIMRETVVLPTFPMNPFLFNVVLVSALTLLSFVSIKNVGRIQNVGTFFKLFPLLFILVIFVFYWKTPFPISTTNLINLKTIVPLGVFGYWGFESCCAISHLIEGPKSNAAKAILSAFFLTAGIYTLFHLGLLHIMGSSNLSILNVKDVVGFLNFSPLFTSLIGFSITLALSLAFANAVFSILTTTASTVHAMASENLLPFSKRLVKLSPQQRPTLAIVVQGALILLITCLTSNQYLLTAFVNLGILIAFFLALTSLVIIQRRNGCGCAMITTGLAFVSWSIFVYFSWFDLGDTTLMRLLTFSALAAAMVAGVAMYMYKKKSIRSGS